MNLQIDQKIIENFPHLKIGVVIIKGIDNGKKTPHASSLLHSIVDQTATELQDTDLTSLPTVTPWLEAYKGFGVNPKKRKPAHLALLERIKSGAKMPEINALVDVYNYFSIKNKRPIGGEDLDSLCGDLNLRYTKKAEPFCPLGTSKIKETKEGEVAYADSASITCRYWNYRECDRTKFTEKTTNAVLLMEEIAPMSNEDFNTLLNELSSLVKQHIGGQITTTILDKNTTTVDLGIKGKSIDEIKKLNKTEKTTSTNKQTSSDSSKLSVTDTGLTIESVQSLLQKALTSAYPEVKVAPHVEYPAQEEHGDYATNIALQLSKKLSKPPREIAQQIIDNLPQNDLIAHLEIAGPGFINLFIAQDKLSQQLQTPLIPAVKPGRKIIVEYSQPNIAKPLGVHHLLSTIIGQTIDNILRELQFDVTSINYIGDWGTQFGKLTYAYKAWGDRGVIEQNPIQELLKLYVKFHDEAEKDPALDDKGRAEFLKFEQGDQENRQIWEWIVEESLKDVQKTYKKLGGIHFDLVQGESFLEDKMESVLQEGKKQNIFTTGEQGALVAEFSEQENLPTVPVQKKDGATLYITRDIANLKYRIQHYNPEKILYVVDHSQSLHFKQFFAIGKKLGYSQDQPVHISFGRMSMKDKKMSTRKGNIILLDDVIDEAEKRAHDIIKQKNPNLQNINEVARKVSIAAIKYNILSQNRSTDIVFDWDKMLSFDGNSAPYLLYTYARISSILRKQNQQQDGTISDPGNLEQLTASLLRKNAKYPEILVQTATESKPNILCHYLFELAQKLNAYYNAVPILKAQHHKNRRIQTIQGVASTLQKGLKLLGIETVEQM